MNDTSERMWNCEDPILEITDDLDVPRWIDQDISPNDVAAIVQDGCASGAYMPAVTYSTAQDTMGEHGDDVLQFIEDHFGELPQPDASESWSGMAVFYLSVAVELWASSVEDELENILEEMEPEC